MNVIKGTTYTAKDGPCVELGVDYQDSLQSEPSQACVEQFLYGASNLGQYINSIDEKLEDMVMLLGRGKKNTQPSSMRQFREQLQEMLVTIISEADSALVLLQQLSALQQDTMQQQDMDGWGPGSTYERVTASSIGSYYSELQRLSDIIASFKPQVQEYELSTAKRKVGVATGQMPATDQQLQLALQSRTEGAGDADKHNPKDKVQQGQEHHVVLQILSEASECYEAALQMDSQLSKLQQVVGLMAALAEAQADRAEQLKEGLANVGGKARPRKTAAYVERNEREGRWVTAKCVIISVVLLVAVAAIVVATVVRMRAGRAASR